MFTTLFRFDLAYYGLFKRNLKRLVDYPVELPGFVPATWVKQMQCRSREAIVLMQVCQNLIPTAWFQSDPILILICRMIAIAAFQAVNQAAA